MGRPCPIMVESSGMDIWNPPSPTSAKTSLSGRANCAPIADGRPKPMAPSPPELIHRRGALKRINCAAHIWCWPTSEHTMAWPAESRSISIIRCCGLISESEVAGARGCSGLRSDGVGPRARNVEADQLGGPHRVLAYVGPHDGLARREPVDFHHQVLRLDFGIGGDWRQGMLGLPGADLRPPGLARGGTTGREAGPTEIGKCLIQSPEQTGRASCRERG